MIIGDGEGKVLGHFVTIEHGADLESDFGLAAQGPLATSDSHLDLGQVPLGGIEQIFALACSFGGQSRITADDQPFIRIVRGVDAGEVALVEE